MQVTGVNVRTSLCDAGLPAAVEIKQLMVSHARMQSRPSDGAEQKVEGRHVSGRGSRGAFVSRQWQRGLEGAFFSPDAIHRQFVRARLLEPGPKTGEQLEPSLVIDQRGPPRTSSRCEWRQKRDKTRRVFNIAVIKWRRRTLAPPLSWGIHRAKREVSPLLVINIFTTTTEKCTSGSRFGINWGLMLDN